MNIVIIGGAGFIGSQLALFYKDKGNKVTIYDNCHRNALQYFNSEGIDVENCDISQNVPKLSGDVIIDCAAICGIHSTNDVLNTLNTNIIGIKNILESIDKCKHFIYLSTSEVEGLSPKSYQYALFEPRWSYAISKAASEYYCLSSMDKIPITIVRPCNVFGRGQVGDSAITNFIRHALTDREFTLYDDGKAIRDWCYIDDFVTGIDIILSNKDTIGKTYTIGNPNNSITNIGLVKLICNLLDVDPIIKYKPHFCTDIRIRKADIMGMIKIGWTPDVMLKDAIRYTINWYLNTFIGV